MNPFFCKNHPIKPAIQNWSQILEYEQVKLLYFFAALRAAVRKYRLGVCKLKKSKIPKLCQNIGLGKLFLEKQLLVRLDFYFTRTATESVLGLSRLRWAPFEHFFEFGALFCILSTLTHFFALWATFEEYFTFRADFEQRMSSKTFESKNCVARNENRVPGHN